MNYKNQTFTLDGHSGNDFINYGFSDMVYSNGLFNFCYNRKVLTFYLVRHGMKLSAPFDPPLTKLGIKQAEITAKCLKNISFKSILASPKLRTRQTAEEISKPHSLHMSTDIRLIERLEWENSQSFDDFNIEWTKTDIDRDYVPKKGKSSHENGRQMREVLDESSIKYEDGNILIVSHGGSIADLLRNIFTQENLPHQVNPKTGAKYMKIQECSVTVIRKQKENYKLVKINDISHLL